MPARSVRVFGLAPPRVLAVALGLSGAAMVLLGSSMKVVTVGRGPLSASLSLNQIERDGKSFVVVLVLLATMFLLLAQLPYWRYWSVFATAAYALLLVVSIAALDQADRPEGAVEIAARLLVNPRPASGFYVLVLGSLSGLLGSVVTLFTRRERVAAIVQVAHAPDSSRSGDALETAVGGTRPGWYRDPDSPEMQRWWDGAAWTPHRRAGQPLPPPSPPSR